MNTLSINPDKQYTYADYLKWELEDRLELLRGFVSRMSAPGRRHQKLAKHLMHRLFDIIEPQTHCEVYDAPFDVRLPQTPTETGDDAIYTVVQPDLVVVCDPAKLDERGCIGAPDLVVEIISPSTLKKDGTEKKKLYEEHGIKEYWLIYPKEEVVHRFNLREENRYGDPEYFSNRDILTSEVIDGLELNLTQLFERARI